MTDTTEPNIPIEPPILLEPPRAGTELDTLLGSLERNRRTLAWKCANLDSADMARTIGVSAITLGGLIQHLTQCEADSFAWKLHDQDPGATENDGWTWTADDDVDELWRRWYAAVDRSRELVAIALAGGGLDWEGGHEFPGWGAASLRRVLIDMVEEYARHTGHADLIREVIDGRVGEDAPR